MYVVATKVAESKIDGFGVFAIERIPKGTKVWVYDPSQDLTVAQDDFENLSDDEKQRFSHSAYLSPWSGVWICPPKDDASNYTNHSNNSNLTVEFDESISSEPYFVANCDIEAGEEITNNYHEFDMITRRDKPTWAEHE